LWILALLTGISAILMLLGMDSTTDKPCVLRKAEHRLRKKDKHCAKAQRKKLISAGDFHEPSPISGFRACQLSFIPSERRLNRQEKSLFSLKKTSNRTGGPWPKTPQIARGAEPGSFVARSCARLAENFTKSHIPPT
jgi:hypothetical protein